MPFDTDKHTPYNPQEPEEQAEFVPAYYRHPLGKIFCMLLIFFGVAMVVFFTLIHYKEKNKIANTPSPDVAQTPTTVSSVIADKETLYKNFSYNGKPIYPGCVQDLFDGGEGEEGSGYVTLEKCSVVEQGTPDGLVMKETYKENTLAIDNKFEVDYTDTIYGTAAGYISYEPILQQGDLFVLKSDSSGGGSGQFSSLDVVQNHVGILTYYSGIDAGDRCNGGITGVHIDAQGKVVYGINMTPYTIIEQAGVVGKLDPFVDLEDSARSCFGIAGYTYDLTTGANTFTTLAIGSSFEGVDAETGRAIDEKGWTSMYKKQSCFNKVYNSYVDSAKYILDEAALTALGNDFIKSCVKQ